MFWLETPPPPPPPPPPQGSTWKYQLALYIPAIALTIGVIYRVFNWLHAEKDEKRVPEVLDIKRTKVDLDNGSWKIYSSHHHVFRLKLFNQWGEPFGQLSEDDLKIDGFFEMKVTSSGPYSRKHVKGNRMKKFPLEAIDINILSIEVESNEIIVTFFANKFPDEFDTENDDALRIDLKIWNESIPGSPLRFKKLSNALKFPRRSIWTLLSASFTRSDFLINYN